jgi:hypothetical protein
MKRSALFLELMMLTVLGGSRGLAGDSFPPIVFVSRQLGDAPKPGARQAAVERATRGSLLVLEPSGSLRTLVDASRDPGAGLPVDVMEPDVSYDGGHVLFTGYVPAESGWRIFEIGADGGGLRQVTRSDRAMDLTRYGPLATAFESYDDLDPCYLPGGRICFVSTRYPEVAPDGRVRSTNLHVMNGDGTGLHRITTERFGADSPTVEPSTGQIVYSRWWRTAKGGPDAAGQNSDQIPPGSPGYGSAPIDASSDSVLRGIDDASFPGLNSWFLASINPDGTSLAMYSGFRLDRTLTQAHRPSFLAAGQAVALFIPHTPFYGYPRGDGLRLFTAGPSLPLPLGGPQAFDQMDATLPPPLPATPYIYASAASLPDGGLLVTAANQSTMDYGLYIQRGAELPVLYKNLPGTAELDALPLIARPEPPKIDDRITGSVSDEAPRTVQEAFAQGGSFTFLCENIHANASVDVAMATAPPIGKKLTIDFFMNPQRRSAAAADPPILIRSLEVPPDGRIETMLPAGVPLFEVLRRADGQIAVGRDGQIFHVGGMNFGHADQTNRCVGCHAGHSQMKVPDEPAWTNVAPGATVSSNGAKPFPMLEPLALQASNLVDRQTGDPRTETAVFGSPGAIFTLEWTARIHARRVIIHGTTPGQGRFGERSQVIHRAAVDLRLDGQLLMTVFHDQDILPEGSAIEVDPALEFNSLQITIDSAAVTGVYEGIPSSIALAEVEVIGQAASGPASPFVRGDADSSGVIDLTDAIVILVHSFVDPSPLPCEAAADVNADGAVDISDPIVILHFLFLGDIKPSPPFPSCGADVTTSSACEKSMCF